MRLRRTWIAILILLLGLAACSQSDEEITTESDVAAASPTSTAGDEIFEDAQAGGESEQQAVLYDPVVMVMTNTPPAVTDTPEPTATVESTSVPPTSTPVPVQPTNPPPPPPTAVPPTEEPPPPPPPIGANGLVASHFAIQDRADLVVDGKVWFEFTISNSTGGEVGYYSLGVMPKKDGVDRVDWYQQSYKGQNSTIDPGGFSWEDNIRLPEAGNYTLRVVMCFDDYDSCTTRSGNYQSMSGEIPVTITN